MDRLAERVEEASLNAWPALKEIFYDGWLIRLAGGETRRTNSINIIGEGRQALERKLAHCEAIYREAGLPAYFRLRSNDRSGLDGELAGRGYRAEDPTRTLFMPLQGCPRVGDPHVELREGAPRAEWLAAHARFTGRDGKASRMRQKLVGLIAVPVAFAAWRDDAGAIRAVAYGALHDGLVSLQWVATDPGLRGQKLAEKTIGALLAWAKTRGAEGACLQVAATNAPAIRLYERMGFDRELYRYHYRVRGGQEGLGRHQR